MKLTNYTQVHNYEIVSELKKNPYLTSLNYYQLTKIADVLDEKFSIYRYKKAQKSKFYWRLTIPLLTIISLILFFVIMPIKWVFTGDFYFSSQQQPIKTLIKWRDLTGSGIF